MHLLPTGLISVPTGDSAFSSPPTFAGGVSQTSGPAVLVRVLRMFYGVGRCTYTGMAVLSTSNTINLTHMYVVKLCTSVFPFQEVSQSKDFIFPQYAISVTWLNHG